LVRFRSASLFPPAGRGGEGRRWSSVSFFFHGGWRIRVLLEQAACALWKAHHQGTDAGIAALPLHPMAEGRLFSRSSTSIWRLFLSDIRWSSPSPNLQVVCPRRCGDGRRGWICVGKERTTSNFLLDLGFPCALRSPSSGGEDTQTPDCFLFLCARVLFVILEALSSNIRFYRTIEARGPPCNYVPAAFNRCFCRF
jgi:hypothetical protein